MGELCLSDWEGKTTIVQGRYPSSAKTQTSSRNFTVMHLPYKEIPGPRPAICTDISVALGLQKINKSKWVFFLFWALVKNIDEERNFLSGMYGCTSYTVTNQSKPKYIIIYVAGTCRTAQTQKKKSGHK